MDIWDGSLPVRSVFIRMDTPEGRDNGVHISNRPFRGTFLSILWPAVCQSIIVVKSVDERYHDR